MVGDPERWRVAARDATHDLGAWCATGYYGSSDELEWARSQGRPVTPADRREARRSVEEAVVAAMGARLSEELLSGLVGWDLELSGRTEPSIPALSG